MGKLVMHAEGLDGAIDLLTDRVVITRPGIFNMLKFGINAKREIPLASISSVDFRDATKLRFGQIDFFSSGGARNEKDAKLNKVKFKGPQQQQFHTLKERIFEMMQQQSRQQANR